MKTKTISHLEVEASLNWLELLTHLVEGHKLPKAQINDTLITRRDDTLLSRVAWIDGLGQLVKTATIFPKNNKKSSVINGSVSLFSDQTGELEAFIDAIHNGTSAPIRVSELIEVTRSTLDAAAAVHCELNTNR